MNKKVDFSFNNMWPGFWLGLLLIVILLIVLPTKCSAQRQTAVYDTIYCNIDCIQKYVVKTTPKSTKIFAVYVDKQHSIAELIPVTKSTYEYITVCKENNIKPSLGIKLKNGQIYSLIKFKRKMRL